MKSKNLLDSFVKYCEEHPEERFWQALRNWAKVAFVLKADYVYEDGNKQVSLWTNERDTFYEE